MKLGDSGNVVLDATSSTDLCLFKFYPDTKCKLRFSCDNFSVSSGYSSSICPTKVITKADTTPARRWCGPSSPPGRSSPLYSSGPLLFGYISLYPGRVGQDRFRCSVSCVRPETVSVSPANNVNCKCGVTSRSSRIRKRVKKKMTTRAPSVFSRYLRRVVKSPVLTRIIGGVSADMGSVPWQASLAVSGSNIFCGGSLVTDRHVLTAAHCLAGVETDLWNMIDLIFNEYNTEDNIRGAKRKIKDVIIHPEFNENTLQNDIAIIILKVPVNIRPGVLSRYI